MRKLRKPLAALFGAVVAVVMFGSVASASVTIPENPIPVSAGASSVTVNVSYSGLTPGTAIFVHQCKKIPSDPTFDFTKDCSILSQFQINPASNTGSGSLQYTLFRGDEPSGDQTWGCYAPGDTPSQGYTNYSTCYIRVTTDTAANNGQAQGLAFTYTVQGAPVPESPLTIALPLVAASVIGAAFVMNRRRRKTALSV
jgi:hypothetical protein